MATTDSQFQVLYALSTLKLPLAPTAAGLLGLTDQQIRWRLSHLVDDGMLERKMFGDQPRVMFMLTLHGRAKLQEWLKTNTPPELIKHSSKGSRPRAAKKVPIEPPKYLTDPRIAAPRTYTTSEPYVPPVEAYYRNDGNKHIASLGFPC